MNAQLERRNAHRVDHERFESDVLTLLAALDDPPPPRRSVEIDGPDRSRAPLFAVGGAALALVGSFLVPWSGLGGGAPGSAVSTAPTTAPTAAGCLPAGHDEAVTAKVVPLAATGSPVTLGAAFYVLGGDATVTLEIGGELRGRVPDDQELVFMLWADPASRTSLGDPGAGLYYRSESFRVADACFYHEPGEVGHAGDGGLVYRQYVFLVSQAQLEALRSPEFARTYTGPQLDDLGVEPLGYIEVPTG